MHYQRWNNTGSLDLYLRKKGECTIEGCHREHEALGWCRLHYDRYYRHGDPLFYVGRSICMIERCDNYVHGHGLCPKHRQRSRKGNDPTIDPVYKRRYVMSDGYVRVPVGGQKTEAEHRMIMEGIIGRKLLPEETVHHKNGVRDDNRPENLELWSGEHARGSRVEDLVEYAIEILTLYKPEILCKSKQPSSSDRKGVLNPRLPSSDSNGR